MAVATIVLRHTLQRCNVRLLPPRLLHTLPRGPLALRPQLSRPKPLPCLHQQRRQQGSFRTNVRYFVRGNPYAAALAVGIFVMGIVGSLAVAYHYEVNIIRPYHNYPEEVAKKLRRASFFTHQQLEPREAIKYYRQAIEVANELGMDPFSDEIMGIKLAVVALLERIRLYDKAIEFLERMHANNLDWMEQLGGLPRNKKKRTRVLARTVAISIKLGELYTDPTIWDRDTATQRFSWAVETILSEKARRRRLGIADDGDEGAWLSDDETGAALEALAHAYERQHLHHFATPLFLHALALHPPDHCHTITLMANLAATLAQQSPRAAHELQLPLDSAQLLATARQWATKALDAAARIQPPDRTEECDIGCAVATHHLGELAERAADAHAARAYYQRALALAKKVRFQEGVRNAETRLAALAE